MAWTSPRTWVTNEVVTAAIMNVHVRDNLLETAPAKVTARGDIAVATGTNALTRLGVSGDGHLMIANSNCNVGIQWTNSIRMSTACNVANGGVVVSNNSGCVFMTEAAFSGASNVQVSVVSKGGRGTYLAFAETAVADKWLIGTDAGGGATLNFGTGATTASALRVAMTTEPRIFLGTSITAALVNAASAHINGGVSVIEPTVGHGLSIDITGAAPHAEGSGTAYAHTVNILGSDTGALTVGVAKVGTAGGLEFAGLTGASSNSRSTSSTAPVAFECGLITPLTYIFANTPADANLLTIANAQTVRFVFDADGDLHADAAVSASAFDLWDDAHLSRALMTEIGGTNIVRTEFDAALRYNRKHLQDLGIAQFNDGPDGDGSIFVNWMQMSRVLAGAAWQSAACLMRLERDYGDKIAALEARVNTLLGGGAATRMIGV